MTTETPETARAPRLRAWTYAVLAACLIAFSVVLRHDALEVGFSVDDYAQLAMMRGVYPVPRAPLELFTFSDGSAHENQALRQGGIFPWWSHPELRISMCRPLASALMWLDLSLFGMNAVGYQLHSLWWWLAMAGLFAWLLRRLLPAVPALLALALFAFDDVHHMLLGWIAMRNASVATAFGLLALHLRLSALERGARTRVWPALVAFAFALLAGEYAIALVGFALLLELGYAQGARQRLAAIAPWAVLLAVYFALRSAFGFGAYGSGMYVDPIAEPLHFLRSVPERLPVLAGDLVFGLRSGWWTFGFPWAPQFGAAGLIPPEWAHDMQPLRAVQERIGWVAVGLLALLVILAMRSEASRRARFLVLGAPLALVPVLSPFPESRVLVPALAGFSVVLACCLHACAVAFRRRSRARVWPALGLAAGASLFALQLGGGAFFGWLDARISASFVQAIRASILAPELDAPMRSGERVMLLGAADPTTTIYIQPVRLLHGRPAPVPVHLLGAFTQHRMTRVSERAFVLERLHLGYVPGDTYASVFNSRPLRAGDRFSLDGLQATVERAHQGRPVRTRFELDLPLDHPGVLLLAQTARGLDRVYFPPIGGEALIMPAIPPLELLSQ